MWLYFGWLLSEPVTANVLIGLVMIVVAIVLANMKNPVWFGSKRNPAP